MVLTEQLNQMSNDGCESFKESDPNEGPLATESEKETGGRIFDIGVVISVSCVLIFLKGCFEFAKKSMCYRSGG